MSVSEIADPEPPCTELPITILDRIARYLDSVHSGATSADLCTYLKNVSLEYATLTPEAVARHLSRRPETFVRDSAGRWTTLTAAYLQALVTDAEDTPAPTYPSQSTSDWVVFDVEATSDDHHTAQLLQIAAVRLNDNLEEIARFDERLVRPSIPIPPEIAALTGITDE